jgi:putative flippase GtrA
MSALSGRRPSLSGLVAFGLVGSAATATHFAVGLTIVGLGIAAPFGANIVAFLTAFAVSYTGHRRFTFESTAGHAHALPRFFAVAAGGLALNQAIVYLCVDVLGRSYLLALVIVVSIVPGLIYLAGRFWAFPETAR